MTSRHPDMFGHARPPMRAKDCWRTPPYLVAWACRNLLATPVEAVLDVACTKADCATGRGIYYDAGGEGRSPWDRRDVIWCNPPYRHIEPWARCFSDHARSGGRAVMVLPVSCLFTAYARTYFDDTEGVVIYIPTRRVEFLPAPGSNAAIGPTNGVVLVASGQGGLPRTQRVTLPAF